MPKILQTLKEFFELRIAVNTILYINKYFSMILLTCNFIFKFDDRYAFRLNYVSISFSNYENKDIAPFSH